MVEDEVEIIEKPSLEQLKDKAFRSAFMDNSVRESIAAQVRGLRLQYNLTTEKFAERVGISYATVSRLENPKRNASTTIKTLLRIASAFDVALMIKFVAWSRWLQETFVLLPSGTMEYFTEELKPSEDVLALMEWAGLDAP